MNREIKFRDYCLETNQIRYFDLDSYDKHEHDCYGNIMQYIGLKDKNGKDIYEFDIIKHKGALGVIIYHNSLCMFMIEFKQLRSTYSFDSIEGDFEIIGNIYEYPELL